jgi:predicted CoA-binding protein
MKDAAGTGRILESSDEIDELLSRIRTVAVLGAKPLSDPPQPAWYVPEYAQKAGLTIIPVPAYYPDVTEMHGEPVFRSLSAIPGAVDLVDVFRRPADIPQHLADIIAKRPSAVWFQLGIRNDEAAAELTAAGIDVVQDHCLLVELKKRGR